jgi:hypothetical protein
VLVREEHLDDLVPQDQGTGKPSLNPHALLEMVDGVFPQGTLPLGEMAGSRRYASRIDSVVNISGISTFVRW